MFEMDSLEVRLDLLCFLTGIMSLRIDVPETLSQISWYMVEGLKGSL